MNSSEEPPNLDSLSLDSPPISTLTSPTVPAISPTSILPDAVILRECPFELLQLGVDRRLLLNRKLQLKMYRVWVQVSFDDSLIYCHYD